MILNYEDGAGGKLIILIFPSEHKASEGTALREGRRYTVNTNIVHSPHVI